MRSALTGELLDVTAARELGGGTLTLLLAFVLLVAGLVSTTPVTHTLLVAVAC